MTTTADTIHILHVDDESNFTDLAATFLEREDNRFDVRTAPTPEEGLDILADSDVDCIVSDYDMPRTNGIEFLDIVRKEYPDLPFILFTGKGSEEVASDAISAGVSDYLQKGGGTDQYTVLANRIANLVSKYRAETKIEKFTEARTESEQYRQQFLEIVSDSNRSDDEKIDRLLKLGCERFGVENGHLVMIDEAVGQHEVVSACGSDIVREGVTDLSNTYCRKTVESDEILDVHHATEQGWEDDPAYKSFGLECYIGGKLEAGDRLFGTLCFVDTKSRAPFTHNEKAFFDLLLQWFSQPLERRQRLNQAETIFEHSQDALFLIDVSGDETFRVRSVNRAYEELTGLSTADLRGQTPRELLGDDQGAEVEARFQKCVKKRAPIEYEERLTLGGQTIDFHTRLAPVLEEDTVVQLVGATRDITERKQREQELNRNKQQYRALAEHFPNGGVFLFDTDLRYQIARGEGLEEAGLTPADFEGTRVDETFGGDVPDPFPEMCRAALDGEARTEEIPFMDRTYWVHTVPVRDENGGVFAGLVMTQDITEQKSHQRRLEALNRATQELFTVETREDIAEIGVQVAEDILDLEVNAVYLYDQESSALKPVAITDAGYDLVGDPPTFTGGESIAWRVYEQGEACAIDSVQDDQDTFNPDTPVQSELYLPLGEYGILIAGSSAPSAFDHRDVLLGEILANGIVTALEQVDRTEQLRTRTEELAHQNDRLDEFASIVSHDLRNPLNVAEGRVELAHKECESDHLEHVERAHQRMRALIDDLLTLAREAETVTDLAPIDLATIADGCWKNVETGKATLVTDIDRTIRADESRLKQLFENLLRNAVEHGEDATVTVGELDGGFYIEDDGPGIPVAERDDVFTAGYSTSEEGTGFGLTIVKRVVKAHGWEIRVTEGSEGGARFEIIGVECGAE